MDFDEAVAKFATSVEIKVDKVVYNSTVILFSDIVDRTPVGDDEPQKFDPISSPAEILAYYPDGDYVGGRLKGNWQASKDVPLTDDETYVLDADGSRTKLEISKDVPAKAGHIVFLTNNVPYAYMVEVLGHSRNKAPNGMARVAMANALSVVSDEARKV